MRRFAYILVIILTAILSTNAQSFDSNEGEFRKPYFAIKTNMAGNMIAVPNIEIERHMGSRDKYSLMAELWFPWYFRHHKTDTRELLNLGIEGRFWFGRQHALHPGTGLFTAQVKSSVDDLTKYSAHTI